MMEQAEERAHRFVQRLGFPDELAHRLLESERAYMVGMGPSIGKLDLGALDGALVFGVNHAGAVGFRHDLLFLADDRRLVPELLAGAVPVVTIDACYEGNEAFFAGMSCFADIQAVHYAEKIPAILDLDAYPEGLPVAYWTGSVVTDLVLPFAVECGIRELVCVGLDGVDGSFPVTHAWGMDVLTRHLHDASASTDAEAVPTAALVAHLQEKAAHLAAAAGTLIVNATSGGTTEALRRADPRVALPPSAWRGGIDAAALAGTCVAIGSSVFELEASAPEQVRLLHRDTISARADHSHLHGSQYAVEVGFIGAGHLSFRAPGAPRYLTTRSGYDRYALRIPTQSFNTTLSSFRIGLSEGAASEQATAIAELARLADRRASIGDHLAALSLATEEGERIA